MAVPTARRVEDKKTRPLSRGMCHSLSTSTRNFENDTHVWHNKHCTGRLWSFALVCRVLLCVHQISYDIYFQKKRCHLRHNASASGDPPICGDMSTSRSIAEPCFTLLKLCSVSIANAQCLTPHTTSSTTLEASLWALQLSRLELTTAKLS